MSEFTEGGNGTSWSINKLLWDVDAVDEASLITHCRCHLESLTLFGERNYLVSVDIDDFDRLRLQFSWGKEKIATVTLTIHYDFQHLGNCITQVFIDVEPKHQCSGHARTIFPVVLQALEQVPQLNCIKFTVDEANEPMFHIVNTYVRGYRVEQPFHSAEDQIYSYKKDLRPKPQYA